MGSGRKSFSAGHFDKGEMKLISRQTSKSILTSEWITSLRQKGIIISDAEIKYRRWLALSSPSSHQKRSPGRQSKPRPATAPLPHQPRGNRSSTLRQQCLPEPMAEIDHTKLVHKKRVFEKQCRSFTPTTIRMDDVHLNDSTPYQFIIGSRYNHSNIIDIRSLTRLGVYVPRENVGGAFINPAGILPSATTRYGRVNDSTNEHYTHSSLAFDVRIHDMVSVSSSVEGDIDSEGGNSTDRHSVDSDVQSINEGPPSTNGEGPSIDQPSINKGSPSSNEGSPLINEEPPSINIPVVNKEPSSSINDDDDNLMCSSEATTLTMQILDEELNIDDRLIQDDDRLIQDDGQQTNIDEHCTTTSEPALPNDNTVTMATVTNEGIEDSVSKTNSSIIIDMTKLQITPQQ